MQIQHIDTCLACYVLDHCNRDGETLLGVPVDGASIWGDLNGALAQDLCAEWNMSARDDAPDSAAFMAALAEFFDGIEHHAFIAPGISLDEEDDDAGEYVQAWFRVSWEDEDE